MRRIIYMMLSCLVFWGITFTDLAEGDKWEKKADMPTARVALCASVVDGKIYAIGGFNGDLVALASNEEYNPKTNQWIPRSDMPTARTAVISVVVDEKIYVIGGATTRYGASLATVEEYDPRTDTWTKKRDMPTPRWYAAAAVVEKKIYVFGGVGPGPTQVSAVEVYDPEQDDWNKMADMPVRYGNIDACAENGMIYLFGGTVGNNLVPLNWVREYDPDKDSFEERSDMPTARFSSSASGVNGKIVVIGGDNGHANVTLATVPSVEEYDPAADEWTIRTGMPTGRSHLASGAVDGKIYVIGGTQVWQGALSLVEEYTPEGWPFAVSPQSQLATTWGDIRRGQ